MLGRRHRLDHVAVIARVVVAVVGDELAAGIMRREKPGRIRFEAETSVGVDRLETLEEFLLAIETERAGVFLFVGDVRHGAGCHEHGARRQFHD